MTYQAVLQQLTSDAARRAEALLRQYNAGELPRDAFVDALAALVDAARAQGATAAVAVLRAYLEAALDEPLPLTPIGVESAHGRLVQAVGTILDDPAQDSAMQVERLATNETTTAAATAYAETMAAQPLVSGWRRGLDDDPCQLCQWWDRDGRVYHRTHRMPTHPGDMCHPVPVVTRTPNYQTGQQADRAAKQAKRRRAQ